MAIPLSQVKSEHCFDYKWTSRVINLKIGKLICNICHFIYCVFDIVMHIFLFFIFLAYDLSVLGGHSVFSSPPQRPITSDFEGFLYQIVSITLFSYLILEKVPVFPFSMLSAKQGNYWYHFYNVFGMTLITDITYIFRNPHDPGGDNLRSGHRWYILSGKATCRICHGDYSSRDWNCWRSFYVYQSNRWRLENRIRVLTETTAREDALSHCLVYNRSGNKRNK